MTPPHAQSATAGRPRAEIAARAEPAGPFVVNLCSSTTPMALSQPQDPELKRFTFFVSRRLEDGRERFRLHMGYFETLQEAEEWVAVVREFYPGAWAGEAPGKRLRARQQPAASAPAAPRQDSRPQDSQREDSPRQSSQPQDSQRHSRPQDSPPLHAIPVLQPAPADSVEASEPIVLELVPEPPPRPVARAQESPPTAAAVEAASSPAPSAAVLAAPATPAAHAEHAKPAKAAEHAKTTEPAKAAERAKSAGHAGNKPAPLPLAAAPAPQASSDTPSGAPPSAAARAGARAPAVPPPGAAKSGSASTADLSNVREVLASLGEPDATREMPAPGASRAEESESSLSDTEVLKLLESRRADGKRAAPDRSIDLLGPDDTATRRALKDAIAANAPVSFAVQLQWSVQPIDAATVPPLAIFGAYTLYTVEGSREGRRWYGLRLGFFSDAISAKQVAHYVRSEFNSVAVVPVSPQERSRASDTGANAGAAGSSAVADADASQSAGADSGTRPSAARAPGAGPRTGAGRTARPGSLAGPSASPSAGPSTPPAPSKTSKSPAARSPVRERLPEPTAEFKLFDDEPQASHVPAQKDAPPAKTRAAAPAPKRAVRTPAGRVRAREKRSPQTLEETLEILGADQLEIDDRRATVLSTNGTRPPRIPERRTSPFTRLLDRLSERSRKAR